MNAPGTSVLDQADARLQSVLSSREAPPRPGAVAAIRTFGWRAMLKVKHDPWQLFNAVALPILMTLMFGFLFGGAIAGSMSGYTQTLIPGILVMAVLLQTMTTGYALGADVSTGMFDRIRAASVWRPAALVGPLVADAVRYTLAPVVVVLLGLVLGFRPEGGFVGVVLAILVLLLFALSVTWIWMVVGLMVSKPEAVVNVAMLVMQPLAFLSNIFVDPASMPGWLRAFVNVNPVTHVVTAVRGLVHGTVTAGQIVWLLVACGVLLAVFAPLALRLYSAKK
jgi:ABC-2 type transport system permease protein